MAAKKKDFTSKDVEKYAGIIGGIDEKDTNNVNETKSTKSTKSIKGEEGRKQRKTISTSARVGRPAKAMYDPDPQEEYRFTVRMPGLCGLFMAELAYQNRTTITAEFQRLVEQEMKKRPDILESMDELNKLGKGKK